MNEQILNQGAQNAQVIFPGSNELMNSMDLLELVNAARQEYGENPIRRNDFTSRCLDELEGENYESFVVKNPNNTESEALLLNHDQCLYVLMRESKAVRRRVTETLKSKASSNYSIPKTLPDALRLAADLAEQKAIADQKLLEAAPKVQFFDTVVQRTNLMNATQVGQKLGLSAIKLNQALTELDVYHAGVKRGRVFKQWFIDKGYGELKQTEQGFPQPLFTPAGEAWVVERFISEGYEVRRVA